MSVLPLQTGIIYSPVRSRRLGRSLGINLLPASYKLCSFDCVYCHYGRTEIKTLFPDEGHFPPVEHVGRALEQALQIDRDIDYITFSGNGEPTLHPRFPDIVSDVYHIRQELAPGAKLAILSNSTGLCFAHVLECLRLFDVPIMKLDAGDPATLARINRPAPAVQLEQILAGLKLVPGLVIQSVLVDGKVSNARGEALEAWLFALSQLNPVQVQIYSTDRPVPEAGLERVPPARLQSLAGEIERRTGSPATAYWA